VERAIELVSGSWSSVRDVMVDVIVEWIDGWFVVMIYAFRGEISACACPNFILGPSESHTYLKGTLRINLR
jgi:hypothetical protein